MQLTLSSPYGVQGDSFTISCLGPAPLTVLVRLEVSLIATIIGATSENECDIAGSFVRDYLYFCNCSMTTCTYNVTIPGDRMTEYLHMKTFRFTAYQPMTVKEVQLKVHVPITSISITPDTTGIVVGSIQPFNCTTDAGRPQANIQWYLSDGTNLTEFSSQVGCFQPCDNKVPSSSVIMYTGKVDDDNKSIYCTASNVDGRSERSRDVVVEIWYGPQFVELVPSNLSYTVTETSGSVGPITCTADCKPNCTMTWSGPNLPGDRIVLDLQSIDRSNAGDYKCTASNNVGTMASNNIKIIVHYGPSSVVLSPSPLSYTVTETLGSVVPIICIADCRPNCTMTWSGPNLPGGTTSVLDIQNISRNQAGDYQCTAINSIGSLTSGIVAVIVNYGPNSVVVSPSTPSYAVTETTDSVGPIKCTADCRPNCTMTWSGPNLPGGTTSVLNIRSINRNQAGDYRCIARNSVGNLTSGIVAVLIYYGPQSVKLAPSTLSYTVTETTDSIGPITCTADCRPNCTMTWSGPNLPNDTTSLLNLQNINRNQAGDYHCTASNRVGSRMAGIVTLTVYYGPSIVMFSPSTPSYTVTEGSGKVGPITCTADCRPDCLMTWSGPNLPGDKTPILNLQNINRNQAGDYHCTASNSVGSQMAGIITLIVYYDPTILSIKGNTTYYENNTAEFRCHVDSFPKSLIQWTFMDRDKNTVISKDNKSFYGVNEGVLKVYSMSCLSMGTYKCEADNSIGTTQESVFVTVMCSARINTIEYDILDRIAVRENESVNITVPILAYPIPWLYWQFKKNQYYTNITNEVTNRHYINRHTSSLFIHNTAEENFGTYVIYGSNGIGDTNYQIGSFHVLRARRPDLPTSVIAVCKSSLLIIIWKSGFNGGDRQIFGIELINSATGDKIISDKIIDPGYNKHVQFSFDALTADSNYDVIVKSTNNYGQSSSTTNVTCTSPGNRPSSADTSSSQNFPVGFGTGFGVAVIIFIVIVVIIASLRIKRQRNSRPATSNLYEETGSKSEPANIYNELNQSTKDGKKELITRHNETDIPSMYDDVMVYDNQVTKIEDRKGETEGSTSTKVDGGIYMNTEI